MKTKSFTKIMFALASSLLVAGSMQAQETKAQRDSLMALNKNAISYITPGEGKAAGSSGFWGYAFGDYAYMAKGDSAGRGTKQQYKGVGQAHQAPNPNAMEIRRAYLGYDYSINSHFSAYALMAYEGDQDVNDDRTVYLKYMYVKWKGIFKGSDLKIGQQATNSFAADYNTEPLMGYRSVEKTLMDMHGMDGSSDMGVDLNGRLWTNHAGDTTKVPTFIGYNIMGGDNSGNNPVAGFTGTTEGSSLSGATVTSTSTSTSTSATTGGATTTTTTKTTTSTAIAVNPLNYTTDNAKKIRGMLFVNCLNNALTLGVYGDFINYGNYYFNNSSKAYQHSVATQKVYGVYNSKWFGLGFEYDMQTYTNGEYETFKAGTGTNDTVNSTQTGISIFAHGTIIPGSLNIFARYDMYTPDTKYSYNANETFTDLATNVSASGNGNSYKETFMNFGFDWTPTKDKKVHIMPNVWYYGIKNGYGSDNLASDNYMLYRVTFLFAFN
jgi:hypothetical protein